MSSQLPILAIKLMLLTAPDEKQFNSWLDPVLLENANRVDIVTVAGNFSYADYRQQQSPVVEKVNFPVHTIVPSPLPFGRYLLKNNRMSKQGSGFAGYLLPLSRSDASLNLLGYDELTIKGEFSGSWRLAFADDLQTARQENVPVGKLTSSGTQRFPLAGVLPQADLSRSRQLVLLLESKSGSARVDEVSFSHRQIEPAQVGRGIWIWRRDHVLGHEDALLKRLTEWGIKRSYLQVGDDPEIFAPFLAKAAAAGIEVYALDGCPGYVTAPQELLGRIRFVESYNKSHPEAPFAGFQTDIEPYLNKDYSSRKAYYATAYADLLDRIKKESSLKLSVVVPFWFDTVHAGPKSLIQRVVESADEVVVMSYRTDARRVQEISRSTLSLGEQLGKPVWLGIELGRIADEEHREFDRCEATSPGALRLGSSWWCGTNNYLLPGSRISFKSRTEELPAFMQTPIPFASFRGWVLHSYEELPKL
jgi:hypothetical protein